MGKVPFECECETPAHETPKIADRLDMLGDLLEIGGEQSRHRILAYRRGRCAVVRAAEEPVADLALAGRAVDLPDIGATLQDKIAELVRTGEIGALARLRERDSGGARRRCTPARHRAQARGALFEELGGA